MFVRAVHSSLVFSLVAATGAGLAAQTVEDAQLHAFDGSQGDRFGCAISAQGERVLIGASDDDGPVLGGSAYVFERDANGTWIEIEKISLSGGSSDDLFGATVSLHGDRALIGAPFEMDSGPNWGSAHVYERATSGQWNEVSQLGGNDDDVFGVAVSLFGDHALVGAPKHDHAGLANAGQAYLFERDQGGSWNLLAQLRASDDHGSLRLGVAVSLYGARALVGAEEEAAYLFEEDAGDVWIEVARLVPAGGALDFGNAVALCGDRALVGASFDTHSGIGQAGSAFVYERGSNGAWSQTAKLTAGDATLADNFGRSVALCGARAVIGASGDDGAHGLGSAYVFERNSDGTWLQVTKLVASDPQQTALLGSAAALSGNLALVTDDYAQTPNGGHAGAAFAYDLAPGSTYCQSTTNSTGTRAILGAVGSASLALNRLTLVAAPVPKVASGIFFFGPSQVNEAFGNGTRCVGGSILRLSPSLARNHVIEHTLDLDAPPLAGNVLPGSTWNVQGWFRDIPAGGAFFNTSSALSILFEI